MGINILALNKSREVDIGYHDIRSVSIPLPSYYYDKAVYVDLYRVCHHGQKQHISFPTLCLTLTAELPDLNLNRKLFSD